MTVRYERGPAGANGRAAGKHAGERVSGFNHNPLALLLSRLEHARPYGKGHRANCPLGHRSKGTLSITEAENGAVLMKCWAGCETAEVLGALGLTLADLFPVPLRPTTPEERRQARFNSTVPAWKAALAALDLEAHVVLVASHQLQRGEKLSADDWQRFDTAVERIADARQVLAPAPKWRPRHD